MSKLRIEPAPQVVDKEWIGLPGGELEAPRPTALCPACRARRQGNLSNRTNLSNPVVCFACYRTTLEHDRKLKAAGELNTASEARLQSSLPFEPINRSRLERLRSERRTARLSAQTGPGRYVDKRRQAQMAARHALERIVIGLRERNASPAERDRAISSAVHAAELQLPAAWLPFVVSR